MQVAETAAAWWPENLWYNWGKGDCPKFLMDGDRLGGDARVGDLFAAWDGRLGEDAVVGYWHRDHRGHLRSLMLERGMQGRDFLPVPGSP